MRYPIIDGFRGFFLLFMGIIHLNQELKTTIGKMNHHYFGWVEDAQGFVFISGLVVGMVYGARYIKSGFKALQSGVWDRIRTIYLHQAGLILIFSGAAAFFMLTGTSSPKVLQPYLSNPLAFIPTSLSLVSASAHMGILPMYIFFMIATPWAIRMFKQGRVPLVFSCMVASWIFAQSGLLDTLTDSIEHFFSLQGFPVSLGIFFNIFGWQVFFFSGLYLGFMFVDGRLDITFLHKPAWRDVFYICVAIAIGLGVYDRIIFDFWISREFSENVLFTISRGNLSIIYVVAFAVDLYIVVWLLVAGASSDIPVLRNLSQLLHWLFTRRWLVFLGQHSLHVFSYHILLCYVVYSWVEWISPSAFWRNIALVAGTVSLFLPAWLHSKSVRKQRSLRGNVTG